ncbi:MAG TPA: hypothetical protein VGL38_12045 [bacterium]|jgi:hypothetical protein
MLKHLLLTYLKNRADFYSTLLPRIPHETLREQLASAVQPVVADTKLMAAVQELTLEADAFLSTLALKDVLKKPAFGLAWGKTTISIEEAVERSEQIEETGVVLYDNLLTAYPDLGPVFQDEAQQRKAALQNVLNLGDDLRYHRRRA